MCDNNFVNINAGGGIYEIRQEICAILRCCDLPPTSDTDNHSDIRQERDTYTRTSKFLKSVIWTLGVAYDNYSQRLFQDNISETR